MQCIILAAGYATRLYPLTKDQPKPLLKISEKEIIHHIIEKIAELKDINEIYIVTNNKFYKHFVEWETGFEFANIDIKIINDNTTSNEDRLGAIGDINFVIKNENIDDDVLIIAGDNLFEFSLVEIFKDFKDKFNKEKPVIALYDVRKTEAAKKFGIVSADENLKIIDFIEKPQEPKSTLASIGIYFYPKNIIKKIQQYLDEGNSKDAPGNFLQWLYKREPVYGHVFSADKYKWFDIGSHESLKEADEFFRKEMDK